MHNLHIVTTSTVLYRYSAQALSFFNVVVVASRKLPVGTGHCINYYNTLVANLYFYNNSGTGRVLSIRTNMRQWR
jgi:hypothetical protein